ncbi:MAG: dTDP-4-dehydrorhamnose 3,5-epimerase [Marmoricola sp.]|jgi:dTDP-4-dehydrorhamnose 3,5-epimerase|nr:dTDP-4-dehydrorhamnose 3,5-epimerase [Marmoricola sp.]MCW2847968.1 dTDP-4-dehydrorhamnose 3,5-epimerase [Marmoricola sp.]
MQVRELSVPGAFELTPAQHADDRGVFLEWFREDVFSTMTGHALHLAQANCSVSSAGTLRGIHFAQLPPSQAKFVTCVSGAAFDVAVDLRVGSPTYGRWDAVLLDDVDRRAIYLSEGLGHAFLALEDDTVVNYLCSAPYAPGREHGVHPLDPAIGIEWPTTARDGSPVAPLLSPKDEAAPTLAEAAEQGLLATWDQARDFIQTLV